MKPLNAQQIQGILDMVGATREQEFNCTECQQHVSEFAEKKLRGQATGDVMASVENHLALCPECREEFEALLKILPADGE